MALSRALADTSVLIAREASRPIEEQLLPEELAVSVVTIGELRVGVLSAVDPEVRERRLSTLLAASARRPVPIDDAVAAAWARLRVLLRNRGLRMPINDSWIAATAIAFDMPVVTQDRDFPAIDELAVIRV